MYFVNSLLTCVFLYICFSFRSFADDHNSMKYDKQFDINNCGG